MSRDAYFSRERERERDLFDTFFQAIQALRGASFVKTQHAAANKKGQNKNKKEMIAMAFRGARA